jgi:hypothetical protein
MGVGVGVGVLVEELQAESSAAMANTEMMSDVLVFLSIEILLSNLQQFKIAKVRRLRHRLHSLLPLTSIAISEKYKLIHFPSRNHPLDKFHNRQGMIISGYIISYWYIFTRHV